MSDVQKGDETHNSGEAPAQRTNPRDEIRKNYFLHLHNLRAPENKSEAEAMKSSTTFWIRKSVRDTRYHVRDSADPNPPHPMTTTSNWLYGPWEQLILKSEYDKVLVELQKVRDENERMMATDYWFDRYKIAEARIKELEGSQK